MRQDQVVAELRIRSGVKGLSPAGRDAIARWLETKAAEIRAKECLDHHTWNQPKKSHKLSWLR